MSWQYVEHPNYARHPQHYLRALGIIQKDLMELFDFIEPDDINMKAYSYRIHQLLVRICIEVEANLKAILIENGYNDGHLTMNDYCKVELSHKLSAYEAKFPHWKGSADTVTPFSAFANRKSPDWYRAYNRSKHDRFNEFESANFGNVIEAFAGLVIVLSAQFNGCSFSQGPSFLNVGRPQEFETAAGEYVLVRFPQSWEVNERYDFTQDLLQEKDPFENFRY